jgi:hypothetical protein
MRAVTGRIGPHITAGFKIVTGAVAGAKTSSRTVTGTGMRSMAPPMAAATVVVAWAGFEIAARTGTGLEISAGARTVIPAGAVAGAVTAGRTAAGGRRILRLRHRRERQKCDRCYQH